MNIYDELKKDHKKVLGMLDKLLESEKADAAVRNRLIDQIRDELIPHSRAEEAVLYNSIREEGSDQSLIAHSYGEHMEAETLLRGLQVTGAVHVGWSSGVTKLRAALSHHISEEEGKVFETAKQLFTEEEAKEMAKAFNKMKPMVREQSFVGSSLDLMVNMMPSRLRKAFSKFTPPQTQSKSA